MGGRPGESRYQVRPGSIRHRGDRPVAPTLVYNSMTLDLKSDPEPLLTLEEIRADISAMERVSEQLLHEILRA